MKTTLLHSGMILASFMALTSCDKNEDNGAPPATATNDGANGAGVQIELSPALATEQAGQQVSEQLANLRERYSWLKEGAEAPSIDVPAMQPDGSMLVAVKIPLALKEALYKAEELPAIINQKRTRANERINRAMLPEQGYLIQIGCPTSLIRDEDRQLKPLPANLNEIAEKLKALGNTELFTESAPQDTPLILDAKIKVSMGADAKPTSSMAFDEAILLGYDALTPQSKLPSNASIYNDKWLNERITQIEKLIEQFNELSAPYIAQRESDARATLLKRGTEWEVSERLREEQETAKQKHQKEFNALCLATLREGAQFHGEWTRGDRFGKLSLQVGDSKLIDDTSIQFFGRIYDTDLPEAMLDITGRCDLDPNLKQPKVDVTIYDGKYDPSQPTAEVYDSQDGLIKLTLMPDGTLVGEMGCTAWEGMSEKFFKVTMKPSEPVKESIERAMSPEPKTEPAAAPSTVEAAEPADLPAPAAEAAPPAAVEEATPAASVPAGA